MCKALGDNLGGTVNKQTPLEFPPAANEERNQSFNLELIFHSRKQTRVILPWNHRCVDILWSWKKGCTCCQNSQTWGE